MLGMQLQRLQYAGKCLSRVKERSTSEAIRVSWSELPRRAFWVSWTELSPRAYWVSWSKLFPWAIGMSWSELPKR